MEERNHKEVVGGEILAETENSDAGLSQNPAGPLVVNVKNMVFDTVKVYSGDTVDGVPHGFGILMDGKNGITFEGNFEKGKVNGYGKYTQKNGTVLEGNFSNGRMNGFGTITQPSGAVYVGDVVDNRPHGKGREDNPASHWVTGTFEDGAPHGTVESFHYEDNIYLKTKYTHGKRSGFGFSKNFEDGVYSSMTHKENCPYSDSSLKNLKDERKDHPGIILNDNIQLLRFQDGSVIKGRVDEYGHIQGSRRYPNGDLYLGEMEGELAHGKGMKIIRKTKEVQEGLWEEGQYVGPVPPGGEEKDEGDREFKVSRRLWWIGLGALGVLLAAGYWARRRLLSK